MLERDKIDRFSNENPFLGKSELIYKFLLEEILEGRLPSGTRFKQEEISALFKVSRSPVREALQKLCEEGFVQRDGSHGYAVYILRLEDYLSLNEYRTMQEVFGAQLCAKYVTSKQLSQLKANLDASRIAVEHRDIKGFAALDAEFHLKIMHASRNVHLIRAYEQKIPVYRLFCNLTLNTAVLPDAFRYHDLLYNAIAEASSGEAARIARLHRENTCISVLSTGATR